MTELKFAFFSMDGNQLFEPAFGARVMPGHTVSTAFLIKNEDIELIRDLIAECVPSEFGTVRIFPIVLDPREKARFIIEFHLPWMYEGSFAKVKLVIRGKRVGRI